MGLMEWFFYGTKTGSDQVARQNIRRGDPQTRIQKAVMKANDRAEDRKRAARRGKKRGLFYWE